MGKSSGGAGTDLWGGGKEYRVTVLPSVGAWHALLNERAPLGNC